MNRKSLPWGTTLSTEQIYTLHVRPYQDCAFIVALCCILDELFFDHVNGGTGGF